MKKLLPIFCALVLSSYAVQAQSNVTFIVDVTDFVVNGGVIDPSGVHIAGNFTASGATSVADWTPSAGPMTSLGNGLWSTTIAFDGSATDSLQFKYVQGNDWPLGDEGDDWADPTSAECKRPSDNNNRKLLIPATGDITYSSKWGECPVPQAVRGNVAQLKATDVFPNPAQNKVTVRSGKDGISSVNIVSADGKVVLTQKASSTPGENVTLNISTLPVGIYHVMAYGKNTVSQKQFSVVR
jgi:hypothetical protein